MEDPEDYKLFKKYDLNENRYLELNEINKMLKDIAEEKGISPPAEKEIEQIFTDYDKNHDGLISYAEFTDLWKDLKQMFEDN